MITCSYCASELTLQENNHTFCDFCSIELGPTSEFGMYSVDGVRLEKLARLEYVTSETAKLSLQELNKLHPLDLVLCLKEARSERGQIYNLMRVFNKADKTVTSSDEELQQYQTMANETGGEYEYWTRKCWMIENLLTQRMGYFPDKVNEMGVSTLEAKNQRSLDKAMTISRGKRKV